jgi:hypothetical protein
VLISNSFRCLTPTPLSRQFAGASKWPLKWACDMSEGFTRIDELMGRVSNEKGNGANQQDDIKGLQLADAFYKAFKLNFSRTTYHENRKKWGKLSEEERQNLVDAGRTKEGEWREVARLLKGK